MKYIFLLLLLFAVTNYPQSNDLLFHKIDGKSIKVYGLNFFDYNNPFFQRLDDSAKYRKEVWAFSKLPAGARVRFKTSSSVIFFPLKNLTSYAWKNTSLIGWGGCDVFINNKYFKSITADNVDTLFLGDLADGIQINSVDLYLPNYGPAEIDEIAIEKNAVILPPDEYNYTILFYGTSITQGASADRSSNSYPAVIAKGLNCDFYNFGFSGNAKGEEEIQETLSSINADLYVLKYSLQADNGKSTKENLVDFIKKIMIKNPSAKILVVSAFHQTPEEYDSRIKDDTQKRRGAFYEAYLESKETYSNIFFVDGLSLIGPDDADTLTDGVHPNTYGFMLTAQRMIPVINEILSK